MARLFDDASSQYLEAAAAVLTAAPLSMACWFNSDDTNNSQTLMQLGVAGGSSHFFRLGAQGAVAGDPIRFSADDGAVSNASTSTGYTSGAWHHAAGVAAATNSRAAFLDGGNKGTNTNARTPAGINATSIGRLLQGSAYMSGRIAEAAIWNAALSDDDVALLAKGFSPLLIRPENLVAYWPLLGRTDPEIDPVGGFGLTVSGATAAEHARIHYPEPPNVSVAGAGATAFPWHYYQQMHAMAG